MSETEEQKIERFEFSLHPREDGQLVLGKTRNYSIEESPNLEELLVETVVVNTPCPNFLILQKLVIGGSDIFKMLGVSDIDGFDFRFDAEAGRHGGIVNALLRTMKAGGASPRVARGEKCLLSACYTGFVPDGFAEGYRYLPIVSLQGRGTIHMGVEVPQT